MTTAAIVLAGGASRRFGRDKLAEPIDGRPLLELAIDAVRPVADVVLVVLAPGDERDLPDDVKAIHDPVAHQGPLAGLRAGLLGLDAAVERVIVLGGDMPSAAAPVLRLLLARLDDASAAWLQDDEGRERPLPLALRRGPALTQASALLDHGQRRLRSLPAALDAVSLSPDAWRPFDPSAATLRDVDVPADLDGG